MELVYWRRFPNCFSFVSPQGTGAAVNIEVQNIAGQLLAPRVYIQPYSAACLYVIFLKVTVCVHNERLPFPLMPLCIWNSNIH